MPEPLLKISPDASLFIGNNDDSPAINRPNLALHSMHVIAQWSILESFLSGLFVTMLGANPRPGAAMYSSLTSSSAQRAALRAVAATNLADEHNEVFEAILALFATAAKDRNKIAHWVWGHSPQIPEGVLLADPEGLIRYRAMLEEYIRGHSLNQNSRPVNPELPRDQIFVYYERDFAQQSEQIQRLISFVGRFGRLIASPASEDSAEEFQKLLNEPAILERVLRQRKHQRN